MRRLLSSRSAADTLAATKVTLRAIQTSADAFPPLKSAASAVLIVLELSEKTKSNRKGCAHIAKRSAQLVQDIHRQTKDFGIELPPEVQESVVELRRLLKEIRDFLRTLSNENLLQRFARQDENKRQIAEYSRLLDEAMVHFSINLELSIHRLHLESALTARSEHAAVLAVSKMSESERLQFLKKIRGDVNVGKYLLGFFFFRSLTPELSNQRSCD
ncbi:hypothetical protein FB45DRAFT_934424 [Roridomyces roridus]|uniref:Uncharacterized protein n=1 Tax=Roridomyces roridus TaxID=1738132 RepID=A0AAD7BBN4_9AGAR|nr:hypothetical protein FB45DRAFT_934424 [Roridomyces roridus]